MNWLKRSDRQSIVNCKEVITMWSKATELHLCGDALNVSLDMDTFDNRLVLQKSIYLMQVFGVDLGFRFGWHLRGPYCSDLTKTAFELKENPESADPEGITLPASVIERIERFKHWAASSKPGNLPEIDWLELLASMHYIRHVAYVRKSKTKEIVCQELISRKPWYQQEQIDSAWNALNDQGLIERAKVS